MAPTPKNGHYFNKAILKGTDLLIHAIREGLITGQDAAFFLWITRQFKLDSYYINGVQSELAKDYAEPPQTVRLRICRLRKLGAVVIVTERGQKRLMVNPSWYEFSASAKTLATHKREWREAVKGREDIGVDFD